MSTKILVAINRSLPHEKLGPWGADQRWANFNGSFRTEALDSLELLEEISLGHAFCAALGRCQREHCGGKWCCPERRNDTSHCGRPHGYRLNRHWLSAQLIALDFDTGDSRSTLDHLLSVSLVSKHAAFAYTTLSHTPDCPKARVVFVTENPFTDPDHYRRSNQVVMAALPWCDTGVHDPSRMFYGTHPRYAETHYIGHVLPVALIDKLINDRRTDLDHQQSRRDIPGVPPGQIVGHTQAERYVNSAQLQEVAWLACQVEGTGERHNGLLLAALKLGSLKRSEWLPAEVRNRIDPSAALLPAARQNGYVDKYGEETAQRTIADGVAYARPREIPRNWYHGIIHRLWSGGQWVKSETV